MTADLIRILVADDHQVVREGIRVVLSNAPDLTIVGEAATGREAIAMASALRPDVVVMDITMPEMDGVAATKEIVAADKSIRVLVLTMHEDDGHVARALAAGAAGYLVKSDADRDLGRAIRAVAHGGTFVRPASVRSAGTTRGDRSVRAERERFEHLTARERDVLRRVALGYSAPEIGEQLKISSKTVDTYKHRIQEKLDLEHRPDYVQFALRIGLLKASAETAEARQAEGSERRG